MQDLHQRLPPHLRLLQHQHLRQLLHRHLWLLQHLRRHQQQHQRLWLLQHQHLLLQAVLRKVKCSRQLCAS
jgi:hypothetical protein